MWVNVPKILPTEAQAVAQDISAALSDTRWMSTQTTAYGSLDVGLGGGDLLVTPSLRWQRNEDDLPPVPPLPWLLEEEGVRHRREDWSPAVGVVWDALPGRAVASGVYFYVLRAEDGTRAAGRGRG